MTVVQKFLYMQGVEGNASCFLFHTLYKLDNVKIPQNVATKLLKT